MPGQWILNLRNHRDQVQSSCGTGSERMEDAGVFHSGSHRDCWELRLVSQHRPEEVMISLSGMFVDVPIHCQRYNMQWRTSKCE